MTGEQNRDEREWAADKREFVADGRDDIADRRDNIARTRDADADEREERANQRERELDGREGGLDTRAAELGRSAHRTAQERQSDQATADETEAQREKRRQERQRRNAERGADDEDRAEGTRRRQAGTTTGLAMAFAQMAEHLYAADNFDEVLNRIVKTAVSTIVGSEMASITVRSDTDTYQTMASTHTAAVEVDRAQYETNEGPCLDATDQAFVHASSFPDPRWPALSSRPMDFGVQAVASYRLAATGRIIDDSIIGSLNTYAGSPHAFNDEARGIGLILAAHASVAMRAIKEREGLEQLGKQLHEALSSRDVIGQAKGILMERLNVTPEDAFDILRTSSQQLNLKLRKIAQRLTETGELVDGTAPK
jgi:hypothetical protein